MDCTVVEILWYESAEYRAATLRRLHRKPVVRVKPGQGLEANARKANQLDRGDARPVDREEVA